MREPFEGIQLSPSCQRESGVTPLIPASGNAQRRFSKNASKNARAARARERFSSRVLQSMVLFGLSSAGFPTGGSGLRQTLSPVPKRTSFPLPSTGRLYSHREAPLLLMQLFESNTRYSGLQGDRPNFSRSQLRLPENNNPAT